MLASRNHNDSVNGQVIETEIQLQTDLTFDMHDKFAVFSDTASGIDIVRIHRVQGQLMYQVAGEGWGQDLPLTLDDADQLKNLPIMPDTYNSNTYARMDTEFHLYEEGSQYLRITNGNPVTVRYTNGISFQRETDPSPKLTIDTASTTSHQRLDMNSERISSLANPTTSTDAVNRQFLDKYDVPIGTVLSFFGNTIPAGYLYCAGQTFVVGDYPELNTLLGGNTLPDLRGQFLRGDSQSNAVDPEGPRSVGSNQTDTLKSHSHSGTTSDAYFCENRGLGQNLFGNGSTADNDNDLFTRTVALNIDPTGGAETRPKNICVRFIIKALLSRNI